MSKLKFYAAMFAVVIGLFTAFNQTAHGQTIINPSFETDNVPPAPGYGAITGWNGGSGINNATGPFADNGAIPDGQKVAFIQGGTMRQTVSGFTVGVSYRLRYYENRRSATNAANLQVTVGGATVVPTHAVVAVGGTNPYVLKISEPFTATAAALEIAFISSGTGDYTVLLDNIEVGRNLVVTNNLDGGAGSLRQTVIDATAGSIISFSNVMRGTISFMTGQIVIDKNLTIAGPGADFLTVRNGASSRIFQVNSGVTATISGLTIEDGTNGGISNAGTLTVADCVIRSNKGSGIQNSGNLTVVNSVLSDNESGTGGAIYNSGTAAITNSNILHNSAKKGGGIYNDGNLSITNSSITGNIATGEAIYVNNNYSPTIWGSAILNQNGRATITNSTIAGNDDQGFANEFCYIGSPTHTCPPGTGTAILMLINVQGGQAVELNLINSTVADNIQIAEFSTTPFSVTARNSIINGLTRYGLMNPAVLNSQGYNLIVDTTGMTITGDTTGNILNADPRLGPLGYYGGPTQTQALLTGSPAINAGNTATSPAADQRGASRVGAADIGAFELNNSANGGTFVVQLPDAFTEIAYSHLLVEDGGGSLTGGALPTGISLSTTESSRVTVSGRTAQTGVFAFSVTATDYRIRVLPSGAPPFGGCRSNVVVANKSDAGEGTLRQAVIDACAGGTISFGEAARGKIHLTGGPIAINKNLTITGPGADALTLRSAVGSGPQNNVVLVNPGVTAVISGLTVSDGFADVGGGISNGGNLTVRNVVLSNNRGIYAGGAIENYGTLILDKSLVTDNGRSKGYADDRLIFVTEGGGIHSYYNNASLTITDSTVSGNNANLGGGIYAKSAAITNTTIGDNRVSNGVLNGDGLGGGLYLDDLGGQGMTTLTNCTVSQNTVSATSANKSEGGGIYNRGGRLSLINTTVANNVIVGGALNRLHGAGISIFGAAIGTVNARNSMIAGNKTNSDAGSSSTAKQFYGTLTSQGYNLIGSTDEAQITGVTTGNIVAADPRLSPLGYYGGPTMTQALLTGSPAINAGNTATSPATDQRGAARVGTADIGAFELNNSANGGTFVVQLPNGVVQTPYSYTVADFPVYNRLGATDNTLKYTYTVTGGALPPGISLSTTFYANDRGNSERENVKVIGTPTQTGIFNFSVTATSNNGAGFSTVTNYRLQIYALPNGNFDSADCSSISGWAWNPQQPNTPISVNIYADDNLVGSVSASQFRQDLLDAGIGNGVHGFSVATPASLKDGQPHRIRVLIVSTLSDINGSPKTITCATPPDLTITKTHTGNFTQGDTGKTYSIVVTNSGGTATSGLVSVSDALPNGLAATAINGTGWNCNFSNLTCTRTDALAGGASFPAINITVNVAANAPGSVTNFASVSGGGETNTANNQAADPTTINAAPLYSISGTVKYGTTNAGQPDSFVSGVNLNATGTASALAISNGSGNYFLSNLLGGNYTVTPTKTGEVRGINSLDATRIQQHLVGMTTLTANQLIAADTDGNGFVNSLDATRIQQSLIGMQTSNIIGQWKFVPGSRQYNSLGGNAVGQDYQAVLVGEVSGNWATSFADYSEAKEEENLSTTDAQTTERFTDNLFGQITENVSQSSDSLSTELLSPAADIQVSLPTNAMRSIGSTVTIPITVGAIPAGMSLESFDFSVFYNPAVLQPDATAGSNVGTLSANCSVLPFSPLAGKVIVSGACAQAITTGSGVIYNLTFNVIGAVGQTSSLSFLNVANNNDSFQFNNGLPTVATTNGLFTVLAPTAASVSVSGRVLTNDGRGLQNAIVTMTDSTGAVRSFRSSSFGYFHFEDVGAGQTYIFQVNSKRYSFAPQVVTVTEDLTELNFTAQ